jgi:predicted nucleic-acid-binding protein
MRQYLLDANALIRFFLNDNLSQVKVIHRIFAQALSDGNSINLIEIIIFETVYILLKQYHIPKVDIYTYLSVFIKQSYIKIENKEKVILGLEIWKNNNISLVDSFLASFAYLNNQELISFDKKLNQVIKFLRLN